MAIFIIKLNKNNNQQQPEEPTKITPDPVRPPDETPDIRISPSEEPEREKPDVRSPPIEIPKKQG